MHSRTSEMPAASGPSGDAIPSDPSLRVMVAAEARMFAEALGTVLRDRGLDVVAMETIAGTIASVSDIGPDVIVVDLELPEGRRLPAVREVVSAAPGVGVIGLTAHGDTLTARNGPARGVRGYVSKAGGAEALVEAIRSVAAGGTVASAAGSRRALSWTQDRDGFLVGLLTPRELEVIAMMGAAVSNEDIGDRLSISVNTVRSHVQSIFAKLQVHSRLEAVAFAARNGLLAMGGPVHAPRDPWRHLGEVSGS